MVAPAFAHSLKRSFVGRTSFSVRLGLKRTLSPAHEALAITGATEHFVLDALDSNGRALQ